MKEQFTISGMRCGGCVARVKAAIQAVEGVKSADVSLENATAVVEGDFSTDDIIDAVEDTGFGCKKR